LNDLYKEDFNQSGKIRSEYRDFVYKYIFAVLGQLAIFIALYKYTDGYELWTQWSGAIILSFVAFYALINSVNIYAHQLCITTRHIRNQAAYRDNEAFDSLVTIQGIKLFTRPRSVRNILRYTIPDWTSKYETNLIVALIIGAFVPVIFSYFFWERKLPHYADSFKVEVSAFCSMYSAGVKSPRASCGRCSL
jgi:cytochrome bd-type quinol oxidase subunit 2